MHSQDKRRLQVLSYVKRIKCPLKRDYALEYYGFAFYGEPYPERPVGLSYLAAQAVRLAIDGSVI